MNGDRKVNGIKYNQLEIVLVPFPFSDLSSIKRRPVLIVSNNNYNQKYSDVIVVVITSVHRSKDQYSILITNDDLEYGMLPEKSMIKTHIIFTIAKSKILKNSV